MSISADSPLDEILNRGPLALLLQRQYEFPFGIIIVQLSIIIHLFTLIYGEQDGRVVSTPAFGSEGPRFDPRQQPLVQLS